MIGEQLFHYRIIERLGAGAMGEVFLAEHTALQRIEALKILHAGLASEPEFVQRFRREARAAHRMLHDNIVSVYEFGQLPNGRFFLAMEYVDGECLDAVLRARGPMTAARAASILYQLVSALAHAHSRGVVHRDIKPANLMLTPDGQLKVLDFSIAKIIGPEHYESLQSARGAIFGTPEYIAPEQWRAAAPVPSADLYAVGCIGYELVAGRPPFVGTPLAVMEAHLERAPAPLGSRGASAALYEDIVLRCLEKDPQRRFGSADELAAELEPLELAMRDATVTRTAAPVREVDGRDVDDDPIGIATSVTLLGATSREVGQAARAFAGSADPAQIAIGMARMRELSDERDQVDRQMAELDEAAVRLNERSREREMALRLAIADLSLERDRAPLDTEEAAALEEEVARVGAQLRRMSSEHHARMMSITDQQVSLAARRADIEERLRDARSLLDSTPGRR